MDFIFATLTIISLNVCGPENTTVVENLDVKKNISTNSEQTITYKKVPTKWVKITKKSN